MVGFALLSEVIAIKHLQVEIEVMVRVAYFREEIPLRIKDLSVCTTSGPTDGPKPNQSSWSNGGRFALSAV